MTKKETLDQILELKKSLTREHDASLIRGGPTYIESIYFLDQLYLRLQREPEGTEALVCADIAKRQAHGLAKYGTTVEANPLTLRQWLQHAYEEALDMSVYLRRSISELDKNASA